jgi:4-hydroxy-tetrahydrodipicolinate synthase
MKGVESRPIERSSGNPIPAIAESWLKIGIECLTVDELSGLDCLARIVQPRRDDYKAIAFKESHELPDYLDRNMKPKEIARRRFLHHCGVGLGAFLFSRPAARAMPNKAMPNKLMQGAFIIMSTPYTLSKAVDYEDLGGEVDFLDRCGVQGLVWPQLSSELLQLTKDERMRGMELLARAAVKGKKPVLVLGVQGDDTEEMLEYTSLAEKLAPDAVIAMPPNKAESLDDYREYYRALCKMAKRPVFIQTSGGAPSVVVSVEFILELAEEFPNFGYVKEEHDPRIQRMKVLLTHRPAPIKRVFGANYGTGWLYEMRLGTDGTINGGPMYADIYAQLWDLHLQNKWREERELFSRLLLMLNLDQDIPGTRRYILKKRGVFKTTVSRQREYKLTPDEIAEIEYRWEALRPYLKA